MAERDPGDGEVALREEIARLNKIVRALIARAERSASIQGTDFSLFQTTILLEEQVRQRTAELEAALRDNERIARALRESEARFRGLVEQSLVGIAIVEQETFRYANAQLGRIFDCAPEELMKVGLCDTAIERERAGVALRLRRALSQGRGEAHFTYRGVRKGGGVITVAFSGVRMEGGGAPALIAVLHDVSKQAVAESEIRALNTRLRNQAIRDPLTGLYNRRYLEEALGRELLHAQRGGQQLSLIMGDIDHFKSINDARGHLAGDEVLRQMGSLLLRHSRKSDICCRYGGEEFLLVLPGTDEPVARDRAERLRASLAALEIDAGEPGSEAIRATASFGVACFPKHGPGAPDLLAAVDRALYAAKQAGRDRVRSAGS